MLRVLAICGIALSLAGCGESGSVFGFDRSGPDEFTVVRHQPLSVPPGATLRPPREGESEAARNESTERARESLLAAGGAPEETQQALQARAGETGQSIGEVALARRAGAYYGVEPDIRRIVDEETTKLAMTDESFMRKLVFWKDNTQPPPGTVLDASKEARRLQENEALGKPLNSGEAPVIVRRKSGISSLY